MKMNKLSISVAITIISVLICTMEIKSTAAVEFFTDCGNGEFKYFSMDDCQIGQQDCFIPLNKTFYLHYIVIGNQNSKEIIANMTVIANQIREKRQINMCKLAPEMVTCPMIKGQRYQFFLEMSLSGIFHIGENSQILPVNFLIELFGDHGPIACADIKFAVTKT